MTNRRDFIATGVLGITGMSIAGRIPPVQGQAAKTRVVLFRTQDRNQGVTAVMNALADTRMKGKRVMVKPNFNTADITPGSTHNDTLSRIITEMRSRGGEDITIGESSGPPATASVMEQKGIPALATTLKVKVINYEELAQDEWVLLTPPGSHWPNGFSVPKVINQAEYVVTTPCLKTHGSGGVLSMSLKLAVGLTPKPIRRGMHSSPDMRRMIAEINLGYRPDMIVMDGIDAFTDGGPSRGTLKQGNVFLGGTDRAAVDAVGTAILKDLGSNDTIMGRKIFEQEQIARAVELKLGITSPDQIEIVAPDAPSREYAKRIQDILAQG
jgi:uncharacterized protein (DUF362 family)